MRIYSDESLLSCVSSESKSGTLRSYICVFPGSNSQYVGMGKSMASQFKVAEQVFTRANEVLGYDIARICFNGSIIELSRPKNALLATYIVSIAYFEVLKLCLQGQLKYVAGHSLGEYSALTCAGALSFEEGLKLVQYRAQITEATELSQTTNMTVVNGVLPSQVELLCKRNQIHGHVSIGCYNSQNQVLITGHECAIQQVEQEIHQRFPGSQIIPLAASLPFHSSLLEKTAEKLYLRLTDCQWHRWNCPVLSNVTSHPYNSKEQAVKYLTEQLYKPVQWTKIMNFLLSQKVEFIFEVGPQTILKQLNRNATIPFYSFDDPKDRKFILSLKNGTNAL